jgi:predicted nuclease of predicted toxin-antitoxin system
MSARKLKILADENIPSTVCVWLRSLRRIDLQTVDEARLRRQEDLRIVEYAKRNHRIILAGDKGFSEQNYVVCTHPGIINVSKFNSRPDSCKRKLSRVMTRWRRLIGHNVMHLREDDFCVVKRGNKREVFSYR